MTELQVEPERGPVMQFLRRKRDPFVSASVLVLFVFTGLFILYPLYSVIRESYLVDGRFSLMRYLTMLSTARVFEILWNSLWLATTVGIISTLLGFSYAYLLSRRKVPLRRPLEMLTLLPMITPPFSLGLATVLLLGRSGLITSGLLGLRTSFFYGYYGLLLVQSLSFAPVAYLVIIGLLRGMNPSLEEAAVNMGGSQWATFSTVTWPLLRPGLANAFLLSFITSLADFGNPMVIGGDYRVLAPSIYFYVVGRYDFGMAAALSVLLLVPSLGAFFLQRFWLGRRQYTTILGKPTARSGVATCKPVFWVCLVASALWSITVIVFYGSIVAGSLVRVWGVDYTFSLRNYELFSRMGLSSLRNTLVLSLISAPVAAFIGLVTAYLTVRKRFIFKRGLEFSTMLTFAVPGTVIGIGYVIAFNSGLIVLTGTAAIIVIALIFRNMPVAIRSGVASLQQIDKSFEEAAINMGANSGRAFLGIVLPLVKSSLLAGMVFCFVRAMTAISSVIFLISPQWPLVVPAILGLIENGFMGAAAAFSTVMILLILLVIALMTRLFRGEGVRESLQI